MKKEELYRIAKAKGFDSLEEMLADRRVKGYYNFGIDDNGNDNYCQCGTKNCSPCPRCYKKVN